MFRAFVCLALTVVVACVAEDTRTFTTEDHNIITSTVRLDEVDGKPELELTLDNKPVARIPTTVGATAALPLEGRACTATVTKTLLTHVEIACSDGPAPGSAAANPSSRALLGVLIMLPLFGVGLLAGIAVRHTERTKQLQGLAMLAILVALCAIAGIPLLVFRGEIVYGFMGLGAGLTAAGYLAAMMWRKLDAMSPWAYVALVASIVGFALIVPRWSIAAPVGAFAIGFVAWVAVGFSLDKWWRPKRT